MRLIDADDLGKRIWYGNTDPVILRGYASGLVDAAPTIEAEPVKHGRWLITQEPLSWHDVNCVECSACHESWIYDEDYGFDDLCDWNYCPNCGARMDEEDEA